MVPYIILLPNQTVTLAKVGII